MIDGWIILDRTMRIIELCWENSDFNQRYQQEWEGFIDQGLLSLPELKVCPQEQKFYYKTVAFDYHLLWGPDQIGWLIFKQSEQKDFLYEYALNRICDGIQIYDQNAVLVFANQTSHAISGIPLHLDVRGRHLLDLYNVDEKISTVMTTLRTRAPVINRFDDFTSIEGGQITSVNTAYPVFSEDRLLGAVVFEQNLAAIDAQLEVLETIRKTLKAHTGGRSLSQFNGYQFSDLIGHNKAFHDSVMLAKKMARRDCNVLLVGETGTGKEIFAQSIHKASERNRQKFVAINCAAIPETLIESMFFGTTKGSFTGSIDKPGLLEEANHGTLFLDELNSMSLSMQSKLLRVIQEGTFRRVGSNQDIRTNIRFISSCNEDPAMLITQNILRRDLFYRLSVVTIDIPPLRERKDDLETLVYFYLSKSMNRYAKKIHEIAPEVFQQFQLYDWPGNVRELFNVLDYALNTTDEDVIKPKNLPGMLQKMAAVEHEPAIDLLLTHADQSQKTEAASECTDLYSLGLAEALRCFEKNMIEETLIQCRYHVTRTAQVLGISRQSLQYRIKRLGITL